MTSTEHPGAGPLSVWLLDPDDTHERYRARYTPDTPHPADVLNPTLAARAIATWTRPGDLIIDPYAGIGATLIEAAHTGRHAVGVEANPTHHRAAVCNLQYAATRAARGGRTTLYRGSGHLLPAAVQALRGTAALVLFAAPPHASPDQLARAIAAGAELLTDAGHLVVATHARRPDRRLIDVPGSVLTAATRTGLDPIERLAAVHLPVTRPHQQSAPGPAAVHTARESGWHDHVIAHTDILVLRPAHRRARRHQRQHARPVPAIPTAASSALNTATRCGERRAAA